MRPVSIARSGHNHSCKEWRDPRNTPVSKVADGAGEKRFGDSAEIGWFEAARQKRAPCGYKHSCKEWCRYAPLGNAPVHPVRRAGLKRFGGSAADVGWLETARDESARSLEKQ